MKSIVAAVVLLFVPAITNAAPRQQARIVPVQGSQIKTIRVAPLLSAADTCFASPFEEVIYRIDGWVTGGELYKTYIDPSLSCPNPYPYTIVEVNLPMAFDGATTLNVSVDVEQVDNTTVPGCHIPGDPIAISREWTLQVPSGGGMFNIWIPLDTPITVTGPFFAGFFIANTIDASANPAVLCDTIQRPCVSFNIWDESIGWVDLTDNQYYNFPGNLAMEVSGIPGGSGGGGGGSQPAPAPLLLAPVAGDLMFGTTEVWADDTSGSTIIDYMKFEYSYSGGPFVEIGTDFDGDSPLRASTTAAASGSGYSISWNTGALGEGNYTIRATAVDTLGRTASVSTTAFLEPTPPVPTITLPDDGDDFCSPLDVLMSCPDENLSYVEVYRQEAGLTYHCGISTFSQFAAGDQNGNPNDGNLASNGEFGDFYSGPAAATMAIKLWNDRGFTDVMKQGATTLSMTDVAEQIALIARTRDNRGTYDEQLTFSLQHYAAARGSQYVVDHLRNPNYFQMRTWLEDEERAVLLGLSGNRAIWVALEGCNGWKQSDGTYKVYVASPLTGAIEEVPVRQSGLYSEIYLGSSWQRIDIMLSLHVSTWAVSRSLTKADLNGSDGWSINWTPSGLVEDHLYFFRAIGRDATAMRGSFTALLRYHCVGIYVNGDYNNDSSTDLADLMLLLDFLTVGGVPPTGGPARADANCDNAITIADAIFYMNYLYNGTSGPCR